jgi:hypothetical protein
MVDFDKLIRTRMNPWPQPVHAVEFRARLDGGWRSVRLACSDNLDYVVKGLWLYGIPTWNYLSPGRTIFNEQAAARLATTIQASVPRPNLVRISAELIQRHCDIMGHLQPGLAHGLQFVSCGDLARLADPKMKSQLAQLAVFVCWTGGSDYELLHCVDDERVYLIDMGNFFGNPAWKTATLASDIDSNGAHEFDTLVARYKLEEPEIAPARDRLRAVTPEQIAECVAAPPECWDVGLDERVALAEVLYERTRS